MDMRCNAAAERDVKGSRDRYETLRTIVRQGDHAAEGSNAIRQALEELGGSQDPAQMVLGVAAALWNERAGDKILQTFWLQCKDMLPTKRWEVAEAGGGQLEGGDRCRKLCCEFIDMLNHYWGRCHGCQGRTSVRCKGCELLQVHT